MKGQAQSTIIVPVPLLATIAFDFVILHAV